MDKLQARRLVSNTFKAAFDKKRFRDFINELLNGFDESTSIQMQVPDAFSAHVKSCQRIGTCTSPADEKIDILIVNTTEPYKLERTRTALRDFVAHKLKRDEDYKEARLVAFVSPDASSWRFSYVRMEYLNKRDPQTGKIKPEERLTPARRYSYIVGEREECHTAQSRFLALLQDTEKKPTLADLETAFSVEAVTKEFFSQYVDLFERIHTALERLVKKNSAIREDFNKKNIQTVDFAKKLLGQIVFLYFVQKKGWLGVAQGQNWGSGPHDFLRKLAKGEYRNYDNFFNDVLEPLFYHSLASDRGHESICTHLKCRIPFLNGGLFEPIGHYDWKKTEIVLPNDLFTNKRETPAGDIGDGVLDVFDRYNFTVNESEPLEKEVAIDPEMLGKVFENLIEENRRKGLGAFYTPREIVHYMCQESLINYLDAAINTIEKPMVDEKPEQGDTFRRSSEKQLSLKTPVRKEIVPREEIALFVRSGDQASHYEYARVEGTGYKRHLPETIERNARLIDEKLRDIAVLDPAIGSGAFPVGMMSGIVRARCALTPYFNDPADRSAYHFKRHAIQYCLYGVDIDPSAVEIAKLRLWLSLVVDEDDVKQIKPLPNLDYKVVTGNSLLGVERTIFNDKLYLKLEELKPLFFNEPEHHRKEQIKRQIDEIIHELTNGKEIFDFEIYFSEVFHKKGGFDVVMGNPPYVRQEEIKEFKEELKSRYQCFSGRADLYVYFFEKGINNLRPEGTLAFISSNKYFRAGYGSGLRDFLSNKNTIVQIIDFGDAPVFDATAYPCIIQVAKEHPAKMYEVACLTWKPDADLVNFAEIVMRYSQKVLQKDLGGNEWQLEVGVVADLLKKLKTDSVSLGNLLNSKIYAGIKTGLNDAFVIDNVTRDRLIREQKASSDIIKPFLKGKDIARWSSEKTKRFIIYTDADVDIGQYATVRDYLRQFKNELEGRALDQKWYELQQPQRAFEKTFLRKKIIYPNVSLGPRFSLDTGNYLDMTAFCLDSENLSLLGVLNSNVVHFFFLHLGVQRRGGYQEFKTQYVKQIPIPPSVADGIPELDKAVKEIIHICQCSSKQDRSHATKEIDEKEKKINLLVYSLY